MDRLHNTVRPYAWGSTTALPALLGTEPTGEPQAELWMGAHPGAPSHVDRGRGPVPLTEVIDADPRGELGDTVVERFGPRLPFLLKLLAAAAPLSLQVHPDPARAREGFADEEARGVPLTAPHRNYRDDQHKPELICALTPFRGLCGFRRPTEAAELLDGLGVNALKPYADILRAQPADAALREVLTAVLTAERDAMADTVHQAAAAAERLATAAGPHASDYAAYAGIARHHPGDPGVIAAMLLNHVRLRPGEALFLAAGVPHAYLDGLGVEIMANSDNVLRCGLTPKHVDVPELLRVVRFEAGAPALLRPSAPGPRAGTGTATADGPADEGVPAEEVYPTPVGEFRLSRLTPAPGRHAPHPLPANGPQILLCTAGRVLLDAGEAGGAPPRPVEDAPLELGPGQSAYVSHGESVTVRGDGTLFRATVAV